MQNENIQYGMDLNQLRVNINEVTSNAPMDANDMWKGWQWFFDHSSES